jgi:regulator of sigma E protease
MILNIVVIVIVLSVVLLVHEFGHFIAAKLGGVRVDEFGVGFPPRIYAFRRGETDYSLNAVPVGAFVRMPNKDDPTPRNLYLKNPWFKLLVNAAGLLFNILLAFILFTVALIIPTTVVTGGEGAKIIEVFPGYPAIAAGIQANDIILNINGQDIQKTTDVNTIMKERQGIETTFILQRDDQVINTTLIPATGERPLGVSLTWAKATTTETYQLGFIKAVSESANIVVRFPAMFVEMIPSMIQNPKDSVRGPVGIAQETGEVIKYGASAVIFEVGSISMGLALFNLIPIPPLDGAGMLLAFIEVLRRGKRISVKIEQIIYLSGTIIMVALSIMIWYNDIIRLIKG